MQVDSNLFYGIGISPTLNVLLFGFPLLQNFLLKKQTNKKTLLIGSTRNFSSKDPYLLLIGCWGEFQRFYLTSIAYPGDFHMYENKKILIFRYLHKPSLWFYLQESLLSYKTKENGAIILSR